VRREGRGEREREGREEGEEERRGEERGEEEREEGEKTKPYNEGGYLRKRARVQTHAREPRPREELENN
jgi:hypothetical protein